MMRLTLYKFKEINKSNLWYAVANSWNTEGVRAADWKGYIAARARADGYVETWFFANYPFKREQQFALIARINTDANKIEEIPLLQAS